MNMNVFRLLPCVAALAAPLTAQIVVDADFRGGNIVVDSITSDTIRLHQDLRDTKGDWFYWYFRVKGAAEGSLQFVFTEGNVIGVRGPAMSVDAGKTWEWLGAEAVKEASFSFEFPDEAQEIRFSMAMPYVEENLRRFLGRYGNSPNLKQDVLCRTKKGRESELIHLGRLDGEPDHRVLITCRHHACEMMASYVLEGLMEAVLADAGDGAWLRDHVEFLVVPFMDKDGVEDGDQGKNRKPYDHNRDYAGESIYPSVRALRQMVPEWSQGRLRIGLDIHCPYLRGPEHEVICLVYGPVERTWKPLDRFSKILESERTGPLIYRASDNLPFGKLWNTSPAPQKNFKEWVSEVPEVSFGVSLEIPYANASGSRVTAESGRAFGRHDLAHAFRGFLESLN
jgi:hypothetical protein